MRLRWLLLLIGLAQATGCTWPVRQRTDQTVCRIANQPYDVQPATPTEQLAQPSGDTAGNSNGPVVQPVKKSAGVPAPFVPAGVMSEKQTAVAPEPPKRPSRKQANELRYAMDEAKKSVLFDTGTAAWLNSPAPPKSPAGYVPNGALQTVAWIQPSDNRNMARDRLIELNIPARLPGSETPHIQAPTEEAREQVIAETYPDLPPLPVEPKPLPGPDGKPYTLTELQQIAAANSPALRQAVTDVQAAQGALVQARTYVNPVASYLVDPSNNNSTAGVQGFAIEQIIITGGKKKLSVASAQKDYENAQLALRRARYDLATQVRTAYFALLVDRETLAVSRAVARFSDDIYHLQKGLLHGTVAAIYEPTALRAQAFTTRLAYQQAIATYIYDWKSLVAILGLEQLPLSEVGGQIDRFIPYYDYDEVLAHVLRNHTDILTAQNQVPQARYNLKLAQVTPWSPDADVRYSHEKDFALSPFGTYQTLTVGVPLAIWDRNKGNIISAQAALARATEQQHNAAVNLTNNFANAYTNYRNALVGIDYYRRYILPDLVRYYRGVQVRRQLDPAGISIGDLAFAQQNLSQNVQAYLGVLGNLWTSVVGVADFLQTDDLFQMATARPLPELPDFSELSTWACGHPHLAASCGVNVNRAPGAQSRPPAEVPTGSSRNGREPQARSSTGDRAGASTAGRVAAQRTNERVASGSESVGNALRGVPQTIDGSTNSTPRNATEGVPYRNAKPAPQSRTVSTTTTPRKEDQ
jgi:outer membrane protein, heavy metal efflux system